MSPVATANGVAQYWESIGNDDAPPILLIPGVGGQMLEWDEAFCQQLVDGGKRVIRYDLRDSGRSSYLNDAPVPRMRDLARGDFSDVAYKLADLANDAAGLLMALSAAPAHVVGHSLGGMIAQVLAVQHPQLVDRLTSMSSTTGNHAVGQARPELLALKSGGGRNSGEREIVIDAWVESRRSQSGSGFFFDEPYVRSRMTEMYDRANYPAGRMRHFGSALSANDRTAELQGVTIPALVIHGEDDPLVDVSGGIATATAIAGTRLVIIPGMGHNLVPEVFEQISQEILAL